jgi:hypothetical protein
MCPAYAAGVSVAYEEKAPEHVVAMAASRAEHASRESGVMFDHLRARLEGVCPSLGA